MLGSRAAAMAAFILADDRKSRAAFQQLRLLTKYLTKLSF